MNAFTIQKCFSHPSPLPAPALVPTTVQDSTFISGGSEMEEVKTKISQVEAQISAVEDEIDTVEDKICTVEEDMCNCKRYRYDCAKKCVLHLVPPHLHCSILFVCVTVRLTNTI